MVHGAPDAAPAPLVRTGAGDRHGDGFGSGHSHDADGTQLGGATITLSGAQPGNRLDLDGFTLHSENGRVMIGETGIELVGGGFSGATGSLTLSGKASPETYASVIQSIVLESHDASGLAAGSHSIAVTLFDGNGAASALKTVDVVVDELGLPHAGHHGPAGTASEAVPEMAGIDVHVLATIGESVLGCGDTGAWTDQIDHGATGSTASTPVVELDHPVHVHTQHIDDFHVDLGRVHWS